MLDIELMSLRKAKSMIQKAREMSKKAKKKSPVMQEYEGYLKELGKNKAAIVNLKEDDKFLTIKYRLRTAAKSLGVENLRIEKCGDKVLLYRESKPRVEVASDKTSAEIAQTMQGREAVDDSEEEVLEDKVIRKQAGSREGRQRQEEEGLQLAGPAQVAAEPNREDDDRQQDEGLVFGEEWEEALQRCYKVCETRIEKYAGDTFEAFGIEFVVTKRQQLPLSEVAENWFRENGCYSPREFKEVWKQAHGGVFDPEQMVWLHHFKKPYDSPAQQEIAEPS